MSAQESEVIKVYSAVDGAKASLVASSLVCFDFLQTKIRKISWQGSNKKEGNVATSKLHCLPNSSFVFGPIRSKVYLV